MLWQYKKPIIKNVFMNDLEVIIDEPELEQAIYTKLTDELNLITLLNNPDDINDKYKLTFKNKKLTNIKYNDEMDNKILITFKNIKLNKKIKDVNFKFIPPTDYDIIDK